MTIRMIRQKDDYSCGIACIAMVSGISFKDALIATKKVLTASQFKHGMIERDLDNVLKSLGCKIERLLYPEITKQVPHIILVPSLNVVGGNHYVVSHFVNNMFSIYDPQYRRKGKKYYALDRETEGVQLKGYSSVVRINSNKKQNFLKGKRI